MLKYSFHIWKGDRVVDGTCLENKRAGNGTVGSNPTPSAKAKEPTSRVGSFALLVGSSPRVAASADTDRGVRGLSFTRRRPVLRSFSEERIASSMK